MDDIVAFGSSLFLLATDPAAAHGTLLVSHNAGRTWTRQHAPAHNAAAGSHSTIQVLVAHQVLLTTYDANGPVLSQYLSNDAGASWKSLGRVDVNVP